MAKNHIARGALFKDAPINDGKTRPVMHIVLEVCGVNLNLAVWPAQKSDKGTTYWPVNGDYHEKEIRRLVDVTPVFGTAGSPSSDRPAERSAPDSQQPVDSGEPMPF